MFVRKWHETIVEAIKRPIYSGNHRINGYEHSDDVQEHEETAEHCASLDNA